MSCDNARKANGSRWTLAVESTFYNRLNWCDTDHIRLQPSTIAADQKAAQSADKRDRAKPARRQCIRIVKEEPVSVRPNPARSSRGYVGYQNRMDFARIIICAASRIAARTSAGQHIELSAGGGRFLIGLFGDGPISVRRGAADGDRDCSRYAAQDHSNHRNRVQFG